MKYRELKELDASELSEKLSELKKELMKHNAQISTGTTPKSPGQVRQIKKTIAKIFSLLENKEGKNKQ